MKLETAEIIHGKNQHVVYETKRWSWYILTFRILWWIICIMLVFMSMFVQRINVETYVMNRIQKKKIDVKSELNVSMK